MSSSTGTGWAQLRQQARTLETQTESLFHTYSQFAQISNIPPSPTEEQKQTESKINELFEKQNNLSRHREVLQNDRREFNSLKSTLQSARQRADLLTNVRSDIDAYHASSPSAEADYMLGERNRIENSHNMADSVLSQAYAVNEQFGLQRETLAGIQRRIQGAAAQVPGLNSLINRISAKKRRDMMILGTFIGVVCLLFLYFL
ncbi:hypothetical protein VE04_01164 [Pseudogymnoascus sp. 24MN13]|nr:hypothetical protein VE04_01164 [Pseudogymnoascus sp. 24MN13]